MAYTRTLSTPVETSQSTTEVQTASRSLVYVAFSVITVILIILQVLTYADRDYRQDEAWIVHGNLDKTVPEIVRWVANNIHPPLWMMTADVWVSLVGQYEVPVRHFSVLMTMLSLALVFRLATDLFDLRVGIAAIILLGASSFFMFYSYEFRPYPMLLTFTIAAQLAFVRWIRKPTLKHALLFVFCGIGALYSHFFAVYLFAALFIFTLIFVPRRLQLRAIGLFMLVGLSFSGWLLPFLHAILVINPEGVNYAYPSDWESVGLIYQQMGFQPQALSAFLFLIAIALPIRDKLKSGALRFEPHWRKVFVLLVPLAIFALAFVVNLQISTLTRRNMVIILPPLAILLAYGLTRLPRPAQVTILLLILIPATQHIEYEAPGPYGDMIASMASRYEAGSPVIVNIQYVPWHIPALYYLQERLPVRIPGEDILQVINPKQDYTNFMPVEPVNLISSLNSSTAGRIRQFIGAAESVWYITRIGDRNFTEIFEPIIFENYTVQSESEWGSNYQAYRIVEYRSK
jgi:hypothetical protein